MKKKWMKLTIIVVILILVAVIGGNEKRILSNSQSNEIAKNTEKLANLVMVNNDIMDHWQVSLQAPTETSTETPTEVLITTPTVVSTQAPTEAPTTTPTIAQASASSAPENAGTVMSDSEAEAKAIELNNSYRNMVSTILAETNVIRAGVGSSALSENATLTQVAMFRAAEIAKSSSPIHQRPNGLRWETVYNIYNLEYNAAAENIAWNSDYLVSPVDTWKTSKTGHYENMINIGYSKIGIGVAPGIYNGKQGFYYVQEFSD